jgi:hypothetical protein
MQDSLFFLECLGVRETSSESCKVASENLRTLGMKKSALSELDLALLDRCLQSNSDDYLPPVVSGRT